MKNYIVPSREEILDALSKNVNGVSVKALLRELNVQKGEVSGVIKRLAAMVRDEQVTYDRKGNYRVNASTKFISGRVLAHPNGFGFVIRDDGGEDIFLSDSEMEKVMNNDHVKVRVKGRDKRGRPEGIIVSVISRANTHIVGKLIKEHGSWLIAPEDKQISHDILVEGPVKAKAGTIVNAEIVTQPARYAMPTARIVEVLGNMDDPGIEIEIAVRKFGLPYIFSKETMAEADALSDSLLPEDYKDRVDLRKLPLVTIDGEDARDFDDAVYCEPKKVAGTDGYRLVVAIADVSHYVIPNHPIDKDALSRATSVYFPRRVIPMLPEKLSNGLCSLNPNVDRLVMVCDADIDASGKVANYKFYPAVMHSAARLTYTTVYAILQDATCEDAKKYEALVPHLQHLYGLYKVLAEAREKRGAIDFETTETYIVSDEAGKIKQILPRIRNDAHKLIEECMLVANVCAAEFIQKNDKTSVFRIHAKPNKEKLDQVRSYLALLGLSLGGGDTPEPNDYAVLMKQIEDRPDKTVLQTMLLRSMQQAMYSPENIGHFGLAYDAYLHFTSPIRRYPDLLTHRVIKGILSGQTYTPSGIDRKKLNTQAPASILKQAMSLQKPVDKKNPQGSIWDALGLHCSANERRADDASRDVEAWLKCYYMKDKIGQVFTGKISGIANFGLFVQLDDLYVEGLVHITDLGGDHYLYDEISHELYGEFSGKTFHLADAVKVQVARVDLALRQIDLHLIDNTLPRAAGESYTKKVPKAKVKKEKEPRVSKQKKTSSSKRAKRDKRKGKKKK